MSVWKALVMVCTCATVAQANAKSARTAIDNLEAEYAPIGKLAGAARVTAACADAAKLYALSKTIPDATPPTGSVVDAESWGSAKHGAGNRLDDLVEVCKAPDHKLTIINKTETADQIVASVDERVRHLIDLGKSRTLPPAVALLRTTFAATKFPSKAFCSQIAKLTKQAGDLATPDKADATKWTSAVGTVKGTLANLKCKLPADADEQIGSSFDNLREELAALLLVIPPS
jgi:hypothetical protein